MAHFEKLLLCSRGNLEPRRKKNLRFLRSKLVTLINLTKQEINHQV